MRRGYESAILKLYKIKKPSSKFLSPEISEFYNSTPKKKIWSPEISEFYRVSQKKRYRKSHIWCEKSPSKITYLAFGEDADSKPESEKVSFNLFGSPCNKSLGYAKLNIHLPVALYFYEFASVKKVHKI